ncbi:MAG: M3 family metallopeptidase [Candidatus Babeliales bacterium]
MEQQMIIRVCIGAIIITSLMIMISKKAYSESNYIITRTDQISSYFPRSVYEIEQLAAHAQKRVQKEIDALLAIKPAERTFQNTARAYDAIASLHFSVPAHTISLVSMVTTDDALRDRANSLQAELSAFAIDTLSQNVAIYQAFTDYIAHQGQVEQLSDEERYYLHEIMDGFRRRGLHLPQAERESIVQLMKQLAQLSITFSKNIASDMRSITVTRAELAGMDDDYIASLAQADDGTYILKTDYPTVFPILEFCSVAQTRKKIYRLFNNRAYPENIELLGKIIALRDELAHKVGYNSYAALSISDEMAKTPEAVEQFLQSLVAPSQKKAAREVEELKAYTPSSIALVDGKFEPWDTGYIRQHIKKTKYAVDDIEVSTYFPLEKTLHGLLSVYEKFLSIRFKKETIKGVWHDDVHLVSVYEADGQADAPMGYLLLDLHPRAHKYGHACHVTIIPAHKTDKGNVPGLSAVIANFPQSSNDKPALLKFNDVNTFFHEFGHALHALLGSTRMIGFAGTNVKTDFVEMPSQMLEEWLYNPEILTMVSSHYETKKPLPAALIEKIIALKNFATGDWLLKQMVYAQLSLSYHLAGQKKDIMGLMHQYLRALMPYINHDPENHFPASFGHLTGYGAGYYSYLWSKVFALDIFYYIKEHGLLNPTTGKKYATEILMPGGSKDPNELLRTFLGRAPNADAFFKDLGLR